MMVTGKSGMRFDRERIRKEETPKFNYYSLFFAFCILHIGLFAGYVIGSIGGAL